MSNEKVIKFQEPLFTMEKLEEHVTLGLCTKNNASTIRLCVKSILAQDYPMEKIQLIIVDGLSSDGTVEILKSMLNNSSLDWKLLSDEGKGLAYARQLVVDNSSTDYIIWVDGDHILSPDFIRRHVEYLKINSDVGAAEGIMDHVAVNVPSRLEGYAWQIYDLKRSTRDLDSLGGGTIYRTSVIKLVGGYDIRIKGAGEDSDISYRIKKADFRLRMNPNARFKHIMRTSWHSLWKEYFWWGYGSHFLAHKHKGLINPYRFIPPIALFAGMRLGYHAYLMSRDPSCILMPIHYTWKRIAWSLGFFKAHCNGYGHDI